MTSRKRMGVAAAAVATMVALTSLTQAAETPAQLIEIDARLSQKRLAANTSGKVYLHIGLKGVRPPETRARPPLNVALVIDRSGSMKGRRIAEAKRAARMALERLTSDDVVSLVTYNSAVDVPVAATKARNLRQIVREIMRLRAGGSTAIYAGVEAGADEISKFASRDHVNRLVLLSDGLANVGPKQPSDFIALGRRLSGRGMTVSTIGLGNGYNEDIMAGLARTGEGNHAFVQEPADLANFFNKEFDDAISVVAQDVEIIVTLRAGATPVRSLGRQADIDGRRLVYTVGQIVGGSEQVLIAELALPVGLGAGDVSLADIEVQFRSASTNVPMTLRKTVVARTTDTPEVAKDSYDSEVMADVTLLIARQKREQAIRLRDQGRTDAARKVFDENARYLKRQQRQFGLTDDTVIAPELKANEAAAEVMNAQQWNKQRKILRSLQSNKAGASKKY